MASLESSTVTTRADEIDQQEQPLRRAARILHCQRGEIIEQASSARQLGDQHHADQEEIDVEAFLDARQAPPATAGRAKQHERAGADHGPDRLGQAKGPDDDASGRERR